jgi:hypothetical protein
MIAHRLFAKTTAALVLACAVIGPGALCEATAEQAKDVTFDDVKFEHQKGDPFKASLLTPAVKKLEGKNIRIRGYIYPTFQAKGITDFVLVRDNMQCCFGPGAALFDCIVVKMVDGASASYSVRPVSVEGVFSVEEIFDPEGKTLAIYHLDGKEVK